MYGRGGVGWVVVGWGVVVEDVENASCLGGSCSNFVVSVTRSLGLVCLALRVQLTFKRQGLE